MDFEWDEDKRRSNLFRHGVDFRDAIQVFRDERQLWGIDAEHSDDEDRWWTIGMTHDTVLFVVTTERRGRIRLISAREATKEERNGYYQGITH